MEKKSLIPFDVNYRSDIESGKYQVITKNGLPCNIVFWDLKGTHPVLVMDKIHKIYWRASVNGHSIDCDDCYDLFIIKKPKIDILEKFYDKFKTMSDTELVEKWNNMFPDEEIDAEEMTDFEKCLYNILKESSEEEDFSNNIKADAELLLNCAKKEILKDFPEWNKFGNGAMGGGDRDIFLIRTAPGYYYLSSCVGPNDVYLKLNDLEKLPKTFNEITI